MEIVDYYYKILDLPKGSTNENVYKAYNTKIEKYRNLPYLNSTQKTEVKQLKKAKFVLSNQEFRSMYDQIIQSKGNVNPNDNLSPKKEKVNSQLVGDRIFSMVGILNAPQQSFDLERKFFSGNNVKSERGKNDSIGF
jgi:DnaJ-class molecular chaperone